MLLHGLGLPGAAAFPAVTGLFVKPVNLLTRKAGSPLNLLRRHTGKFPLLLTPFCPKRFPHAFLLQPPHPLRMAAGKKWKPGKERIPSPAAGFLFDDLLGL